MRHLIAQPGRLLLLALIPMVAATAAAEPDSRLLSLDELHGIGFRHADPPPAPLPRPPIALERAMMAPPLGSPAAPEPRPVIAPPTAAVLTTGELAPGPDVASPTAAVLTIGDLDAVAFRPPGDAVAPTQAEMGTPVRLDLEALGSLGISRSN